MKNLTIDDVNSLTKNNLLKELAVLYPFKTEKQFDSKLWSLFCFSVENMFSFSVYAPQDASEDEINELKVHLYEYNGSNKTFGLLYPKNDQRFVSVDWIEFFQKDPRSAAIVSPDVLLEMIKFTARLSRMKVFQ